MVFGIFCELLANFEWESLSLWRIKNETRGPVSLPMQSHAMNNKAAVEMSHTTKEGELIGGLMNNISAHIKERFKLKKKTTKKDNTYRQH